MRPRLPYRVLAILLAIGIAGGPVANAAVRHVPVPHGAAMGSTTPHHGPGEARCAECPKICPCTMPCSQSLALVAAAASLPSRVSVADEPAAATPTESRFEGVHRARAPPPTLLQR